MTQVERMLEEAEVRRVIQMSMAMQNNAMVETSGKEEITVVESSGTEEGEITIVGGEQHVVNTKPHALYSLQDVMDMSDDSDEEEYLARPRAVLFLNYKVLCTQFKFITYAFPTGTVC